MCKRTSGFSLRLGVLQVRHSGAVPFSALLFLPHAQRSALTPSSSSSSLVQHFHGYLVVGVFALGVPAKRVALGEARVAELALVGLLSSVHPLMALELAGLPEAFGADGAHKVPLARVDVLVSLQREGRGTPQLALYLEGAQNTMSHYHICPLPVLMKLQVILAHTHRSRQTRHTHTHTHTHTHARAHTPDSIQMNLNILINSTCYPKSFRSPRRCTRAHARVTHTLPPRASLILDVFNQDIVHFLICGGTLERLKNTCTCKLKKQMKVSDLLTMATSSMQK